MAKLDRSNRIQGALGKGLSGWTKESGSDPCAEMPVQRSKGSDLRPEAARRHKRVLCQ